MPIEVGKTIYHDTFGEGIVKGISNKNGLTYISVIFEKYDEKTFQGKYLNGILISDFLNETPSTKYIKRQENLNKIDFSDEHKKEKAFFETIKNMIANEINFVANELQNVSIQYSMSKEAAEKNISVLYSDLVSEQKELISINHEPYFVKIEYVELNNRKEVYFGKKQFGNSIVSWADPRCQMHYQPSLYLNNSKEIWKLKLKRDFDIFHGEYFGFEDSINVDDNKAKVESQTQDNVIVDKRLLKVLERRKDAKQMQDIIATIQENQYNMIAADKNSNNLIFGCAGSGKTMILIHRLTFLKLRYRDEIDLQNCYVISPTNFLNRQLIDLSEELDIRKTKIYSVYDFYKEILKDTFMKVKSHSYNSKKELEIYNPADFYTIEFLEAQSEEFSKIVKQESSFNVAYHNLIKSDIAKLIKKDSNARVNLNDVDDINNGFDCLYNEISKISYNMFLKVKRDINNIYDIYIRELKQLFETLITNIKNSFNNYNRLSRIVSDLKENINESNLQNIVFEKIYSSSSIEKYNMQIQLRNINAHNSSIYYNIILDINNASTSLNSIIDTIKNKINRLLDLNDDEEIILNMIFGFDAQKVEEFKFNLQEYLFDIENLYNYNNFFIKEFKKSNNNCIKKLDIYYSDYLNGISDSSSTLDFVQTLIEGFNRIDLLRKKLVSIVPNKSNVSFVHASKDSIIDNIKVFTKEYQKNKNELLKESMYYEEYSKRFSNIDESNYSTAYDVFNFLINGRIGMKKVINFIKDNQDVYYSNINQDYLNISNRYERFIEYAVAILIDNLKTSKGLDINREYSFEIFLKLYVLYKNKFINNYYNKELFIDEIQDYSENEIKLIKGIFENSRFNFYGDLKQSISEKGIKKYEESLFLNFQKYTINENYRNAYDITKFVNDKLKMNMTPIGINGTVNILTQSDFQNILSQDKTVILLGKGSTLPKDISINDRKINIITETNNELVDGAINYFSILYAKGLEFEEIYVIDKDLNQNEKYVAYTRALSILNVIEYNEPEQEKISGKLAALFEKFKKFTKISK